MSDRNKIENEFKMNSKRKNLKQTQNEFKTNSKLIQNESKTNLKRI